MKLTMNWLRADQRVSVAAGILVTVTQVIMVGSLLQDMFRPGAVL